jgi:hypothetical protein
MDDTLIALILSVTSSDMLKCLLCADFFCHESNYTFVRGMRKELQLQRAYQDFIWNVSAPNVLLTNNAQTKIGKSGLRLVAKM